MPQTGLVSQLAATFCRGKVQILMDGARWAKSLDAVRCVPHATGGSHDGIIF
jgi:hypothetical protein